MKPLGWKNQIDLSQHAMSRISGALGQIKSSRHYVGWKSENIRPQERYFFLTSPFIELHRTYPDDGENVTTNSFQMVHGVSRCDPENLYR